jgi:hypothetical protein
MWKIVFCLLLRSLDVELLSDPWIFRLGSLFYGKILEKNLILVEINFTNDLKDENFY